MLFLSVLTLFFIILTTAFGISHGIVEEMNKKAKDIKREKLELILLGLFMFSGALVFITFLVFVVYALFVG